MCYPLFTFGSSEDFSPQYCHNGIWDYQRDKIEFPDCQRKHKHLFNVVLAMHFHVYAVYEYLFYTMHIIVYIHNYSYQPLSHYYIYICVGFHTKTGL